MSNGFGPIGEMSVTAILPDEGHREALLIVGEYWTSRDSGVELRAWIGDTPVSAIITMSDKKAINLARLILQAAGLSNEDQVLIDQ